MPVPRRRAKTRREEKTSESRREQMFAARVSLQERASRIEIEGVEPVLAFTPDEIADLRRRYGLPVEE